MLRGCDGACMLNIHAVREQLKLHKLELFPAALMHMVTMCTTCQVTCTPKTNVFSEFAMRSQ
jgi:hypothetical protein